MNRRKFIFDLGAGGAGLMLAGCVSAPPRRISANEKLNIGMIGTGNRAHENLMGVASENIVALCDVDQNFLARAATQFPSAAKYSDFRRMLDRNDLDAIVVATPDHTHAVAAVAALKSGRHCYCEKPLARTISETRAITEAAAKSKRATQIGTQIHAGKNYRRVVELVQSNVIGDVKEIHVWAPAVYGGRKMPTEFPPVPAGLDYDLWLGPVQYIPYSPEWTPFKWRNWWHFGGGALADFGCHYMDLPHWALGLNHAISAEPEGPPVDKDAPPVWLIVRYMHPARKPGGEPLPLTWYQGGKQPHPDVLSPDLAKDWKAGVLFIGAKGRILSDYNRHRVFGVENPTPTVQIPNSIGHHKEWIEACKTGGPTSCNFDYSGPLTETALLGNAAYRAGQKLHWDAKRMKALNTRAADEFIHHSYRKGWSL